MEDYNFQLTQEYKEQWVEYKKSKVYIVVKRLIDILASLLGILCLSPLMIIVAVLIKIDSKGLIIFSQERVGRNGQIFKMYKFRSMVANAEEMLDKLKDKNEMSGPMFKIKEDPRITKIGKIIRKTSIDELPQLFNVLKGDMSLVGPRPNLPNEVAEFSPYHRKKLLVKPGLTCYWQVMGRNEIGFEEWMELDIKYLKERTLWIDIKLIIKTFFVLFGDKNAR
ncbi:sugar transferase [Clostridium scatologenes]|uniref:Capsular polysaccharide biosynthsis protein n=1 Tax=Clostridium scatologenes TaxID=1548 RepID=A0A0E3M4M4_CLOSL|nr:exopolysaccharide biosynthesis polyprenyl glycosylphosphotransferase [Clostridium scatologenes]AKA67150.1 capsular polysaccharide biosynthsis protein [Clostridium scatologenes]